MNLILIGMRGSGKSTVGRLLSHKLGRQFLEMDTIIVNKAGMSIPQIVKNRGWETFRDLESQAVAKLKGVDNCVITTGGGVILRPQNVASLKKGGFLIFLTAKISTLLDRIGDDPNRPSLTGKTFKKDMELTWRDRKSLYKKAADLEIDTEDINEKEVVKIILKRIL